MLRTAKNPQPTGAILEVSGITFALGIRLGWKSNSRWL